MQFNWILLWVFAGLSLVLTLALMPFLIRYLHELKFGQIEREEGLASHKKKTGTPTMGGIGFILVSTWLYLIALFFFPLHLGLESAILMLSFVGYGLIGFIDDYKIVVQHDNTGLKPWVKFALQALLSLAIYFLFELNHSTTIQIPFINEKIALPGIVFFLLIFFLFTGTTNAVNLTDGIDGLCAGQVIIALVPLCLIAFSQQNYTSLLYSVLLIASLFGYLYYNYYPAKVFMGDTGSLALGGFLAATSMVLDCEILFILIGAVFVWETLSVIIQVMHYKRTKKRIFRMAPFHHHLEKGGLSEVQVDRRLWAAGIVSALLALLIYYLF